MEKLSRRNIIKAAAGFTGGSALVAAGAALPAPLAATAEPLGRLLARRQAIVRHIDDNGASENSPLWNELSGIEASVEATVPLTLQEAIAQLQYLLDSSEEGWDFDERLWKMVQNVVSGLHGIEARSRGISAPNRATEI